MAASYEEPFYGERGDDVLVHFAVNRASGVAVDSDTDHIFVYDTPPQADDRVYTAVQDLHYFHQHHGLYGRICCEQDDCIDELRVIGAAYLTEVAAEWTRRRSPRAATWPM